MMNSLLLFTLLTISLYAQTPKPIDIETVRKDLLSKPHAVPDDVIRNLKPAMFKVIYANSLCFIHVQYKSYAGEAYMRSSDLIVYRLSEGNWTYENVLQAWHDIELLDATQLMFLANVQFCEPNGDCNTYKAISHYDGKELFVLREYKGFDKTLYYKGLNDAGNPDKVKFAVGDKISDSYVLTDFHFEQYQSSFTLKHKVEAIAYISKAAIKKKVVLEDFQRVIVNQ